MLRPAVRCAFGVFFVAVHLVSFCADACLILFLPSHLWLRNLGRVHDVEIALLPVDSRWLGPNTELLACRIRFVLIGWRWWCHTLRL